MKNWPRPDDETKPDVAIRIEFAFLLALFILPLALSYGPVLLRFLRL